MTRNSLSSERSIFLNNGMEVIDFRKHFPIMYYLHYSDDGINVYSHWHDDIELNCIFRGHCVFYNNGIKHYVKEMGVNIVNSREMHYAIPEIDKDMTNELTGITIQLQKEFLDEMIPDFDNLYLVIPSKEQEKAIADKMYQFYTCLNDSGSDRLKLLGIACDLAYYLYENCTQSRSLISVNVQKDIERIRIIITYINEHYAEPLKQQELAERFYFSREYFSRFFKTQTGLTFKEYLMRYRMEKARHELLTTNNSLSDIAVNNGFTDINHFISWFKKYYSVTPSRYRQNNKAEL